MSKFDFQKLTTDLSKTLQTRGLRLDNLNNLTQLPSINITDADIKKYGSIEAAAKAIIQMANDKPDETK